MSTNDRDSDEDLLVSYSTNDNCADLAHDPIPNPKPNPNPNVNNVSTFTREAFRRKLLNNFDVKFNKVEALRPIFKVVI